ncbi:rhodanese-like domain-containing protein [Spongiimicrobium salis]|uniref:rhodanese-like domain-containing protein n=1 Tax=Spongiimicrobium salis TaxID=1667022 RepID=UPI00374D28C0
MHSLEVLPFIKSPKKIKILDIRTKEAFMDGHIPDAIHLPFPIQLKKLRKQFGSGAPMGDVKSFIQDYEEWKVTIKPYLSMDTPSYIYCQSGGLRSFYFSELWNTYRTQLYFLEKGYEGYCHFQQGFFEKLQFPELYVLSGWTGSGKTALLEALKAKGRQVVNLSGLANHRGSVFGRNEKFGQPTSTQFSHQLFGLCRNFDPSQAIFTEAEGPFIGTVHLPKPIYTLLQNAKIIHLEIPKTARVLHLMEEYAHLDKAMILQGLQKIQSRLSPKDYEQALTYLEKGNRKALVTLLISYYDHSALYRVYASKSSIKLHFSRVDIDEMIKAIEEQASLLPN